MQYDRSFDVYSFAIVLWEILRRVVVGSYMRPYQEYAQELRFDFQIVIQVTQNNLRPSIPLDSPRPLGALIARAWSSDAAERPTSEQLCTTLDDCATRFSLNPTKFVQDSVRAADARAARVSPRASPRDGPASPRSPGAQPHAAPATPVAAPPQQLRAPIEVEETEASADVSSAGSTSSHHPLREAPRSSANNLTVQYMRSTNFEDGEHRGRVDSDDDAPESDTDSDDAVAGQVLRVLVRESQNGSRPRRVSVAEFEEQ